MFIPSSFENQFLPGIIKDIDMRLHDVEYACTLLQKADQIRQSKAPPVSFSALSPETQATAAMTGHYLGGADVFALAHNGIKEFRARRFERTAYDILEEDTY